MSVATYKIVLQWKEFNVSLPLVEMWLKANAGEQYCGLQAYSHLEVWFKDTPDEAVQDAVKTYWDGLFSESAEAQQYVSRSAIESRIGELKAGLISKSWDAMSVAERKLVTGMTPTLSELGLA